MANPNLREFSATHDAVEAALPPATIYLYQAMQSPSTLLDRITTDPRILAGKPVVRGLRIS